MSSDLDYEEGASHDKLRARAERSGLGFFLMGNRTIVLRDGEQLVTRGSPGEILVFLNGMDHGREACLPEIERILEHARHVAGWIGALAPLDHPDSPRAVAEGQSLVEALANLRDEIRARGES